MKTLHALTLGAAMVAAGICHAGDGAYEINQACVDTGCFPGDAAGFPVTITTPGTYRLSSNLTMPNIATGAIVVQANDVTIDLGGFRIVGPITCGGTPTVCTPATNGDGAIGIDGFSSDPTNLVVRNGSITGMGSGLLLSYDGRAEGIKATQNGYIGIRARTGAAVVDSTATANGSIGIEGRLIDRCVASRNRQYGFAAMSISNSQAVNNDDYGIYLNIGGNVVGSTVSDNRVGIISLGGAQVLDSVFNGNTLAAIQNTQGTLAVARSTFLDNNGGGAQWGGTIVQLQPNLCGSSMACP